MPDQFPDFSAWVYVLLTLNVLLAWFAPSIVNAFGGAEASDQARDFRINVLRGLNALFVILLCYYLFFGAAESFRRWGFRLFLSLLIVYASYLLAQLVSRFVRQRYGRKIISGETSRIADTYTSRALSISIAVFISIIALIAIVRVFGLSSLLEAGGVIGFIGVLLALTQGAWAPDMISGLIILNSKLLEERDVIKLDDGNEALIATVYRTKVFHTELLNLVDNHRVFIRNSRVREFTVHNLSRFASARGLRETLFFKIGYDLPPKQVRELLNQSFELACADESIEIEKQHPVEIRVRDAGDHAVEWSFHYYTKEPAAIIKNRQLIREIVLTRFLEAGISLSTPLTVQTV